MTIIYLEDQIPRHGMYGGYVYRRINVFILHGNMDEKKGVRLASSYGLLIKSKEMDVLLYIIRYHYITRYCCY